MEPALADALADDPDEAERLLGATVPRGRWPSENDAAFLRLRAGQIRRNPDWQPWSVRALVLREETKMVGHAGFHGPPGVNGLQARDALELGYTVFPEARGRGYAQEAALALMRWAEREHEIRRFIASVAPDNEASLAIVRKLGFTQIGEQWDVEDGLELVFELAC